MSVRNLDRMFKPASVALIGATPRPGSAGAVALRNLLRGGFKGEVALVNPHHRTLHGRPVFPDLASLEAAPDLAVVATPPRTLPALIAELGRRGTRAAVVITPGFAELGAGGAALQQEMLDAARPHLLRLLGPNCLGLMVPGLGLDASVSPVAPHAGKLAFVSQSNAMLAVVLDWAAPRGIGFSHAVSLGEMTDVDVGDMVDYLAGDRSTEAILLHVEGLREARKFMSAARAAARIKPVLVVKAGRAPGGALPTAAHAGSLAGPDGVYDAAFRRAGILRVDDMGELFDAVETLALTGRQRGHRLAILTNGRGPGMLAADELTARGGALAAIAPQTMARLAAFRPQARNCGDPVQIGDAADGARYAQALASLLEDGGADAVLVLHCPTAFAQPVEVARAVIAAVSQARQRDGGVGRNVFTAWLGGQSVEPARRLLVEARLATYGTPEEAVRGFMHGVNFHRRQDLLMETPAARPDDVEPDVEAVRSVVARALAADRHWLAADEVAVVLNAYGIPIAAPVRAGDAEEAAAAAATLGFPVALKIDAPDLPRRGGFGSVVLDLDTPERVRDEAQAMQKRIALRAPGARVEGFLIQPMIRRSQAIELIVGIVDDPLFGPAVVFGQGGAAAEVMRDASLELPPLNDMLARALMARTRIWRLLQGHRDRPPADLGALSATLVRLGQIAADIAEVAELDIDPLLADAGGVIGLDARIRVVAAVRTGASRLAIPPYPKELVGIGRLADGTAVRLRPVRPEDEPLLVDLTRHMTESDLRFRFFASLTQMSHQLAARLSQIDYDREMALIAESDRDAMVLGVSRFAADPDNRRAEFAVAVRSDCKGRGLGRLLMERLIAVARRRGIGTLVGSVLRENEAMLGLCRALGFAVANHPEDPGAFLVTLPLPSG